jgi:hypothetical protein
MKTKILLIAGLTAILLSCQTLQAQVKFGIHGALNLEAQAKLGELWNNVDLYQGFLAGGFMEYRTGNHLSLQTEINYQKKGGKYTSTFAGKESIVRREFNYVTVPLLIKGNIHDNGLSDKWDLSFFTGPYLGLLTSTHSNVKTAGVTSAEDISKQAEKTDWGLIMGCGATYKLTNGGAIIAELRYQMGLNEIDKQNPDLRNKGMGLTLGYRF